MSYNIPYSCLIYKYPRIIFMHVCKVLWPCFHGRSSLKISHAWVFLHVPNNIETLALREPGDEATYIEFHGPFSMYIYFGFCDWKYMYGSSKLENTLGLIAGCYNSLENLELRAWLLITLDCCFWSAPLYIYNIENILTIIGKSNIDTASLVHTVGWAQRGTGINLAKRWELSFCCNMRVLVSNMQFLAYIVALVIVSGIVGILENSCDRAAISCMLLKYVYLLL